MASDALVLCEDEDVIDYEPNIETFYPRDTYDWKIPGRLASREIERRIRVRKVTGEPMELGRLGLRSKKALRDCAVQFWLHFAYIGADQESDPEGFSQRKARHYLARGEAMLEDVLMMLDYDEDNSGAIEPYEKDRPFPTRFIRG